MEDRGLYATGIFFVRQPSAISYQLSANARLGRAFFFAGDVAVDMQHSATLLVSLKAES
jgi:hypothetical protein